MRFWEDIMSSVTGRVDPGQTGHLVRYQNFCAYKRCLDVGTSDKHTLPGFPLRESDVKGPRLTLLQNI